MRDILEKIGFCKEDIARIEEAAFRYYSDIRPLAEEYVKNLGHRPLEPYGVDDGEFGEAVKLGKAYCENAEKINPQEGYMLKLLCWITLIPYLEKRYRELNISDGILIDTLRDLLYKVDECKSVYGKCGVFSDFFFFNFDLKLFQLGRLQYQVYEFLDESYTCKDFNIKKGDKVYYCHIPSSGKLTTESCMDSFKEAYEFFKNELNGTILPVYCKSWLLYPPYAEQGVFPQGSNIQKFIELFDVYAWEEKEDFSDCWRVFGKMYRGGTKGLAGDNRLRRNFIDYIDGGGTFGVGSGMILYDGRSGEIIK